MVTLTKKKLPRIFIKKVPMPKTHTTFLRRSSCVEVTTRNLIWMWVLMLPFTTQERHKLRCMLLKTQQSLQELRLRLIHIFKSQEKILKPRFKGLRNVSKPCRISAKLN